MTECLLSASNGSLFDEKRFLEIANAMLDRVVNNNDLNKKETMKSRVVSLLLKRLATMLSLTKSQTNVLVRFFKDALVLISPESENMARNIRASYDSCRRQSMKDEEKSKEISKRFMTDCHFFSIAVDTALFGNEHQLSCFARYSFDSQITQLPLFFATCFVSSGKDMAQFMFDKLVEKEVEFSKLVCVSTDGATNMVGQMNGMVVNIKRLICQRCSDENVQFYDFHSVWCSAHRANLVTRDFLGLKMINAVLSFVDWFSTKRRQVSYRRFLASHHPDAKTKRIPQPSETR